MEQAAGRGDQTAVIAALIAVPRHINPAVDLDRQLSAAEDVPLEQILALKYRGENAMRGGHQAVYAIAESFTARGAASATPSLVLPDGF